MIVQMEKLFIYGMSDDADRVITELLKRGCAQVRPPEKMPEYEELGHSLQAEPVNLYDLEQQYSRLGVAIAALGPYLPKAGMFTPKARKSFDCLADKDLTQSALELCGRVEEELRLVSELRSKISKEEFLRASLQPWVELDLPLDLEGTASTAVEYLLLSAEADLAALGSELEEQGLPVVLSQVAADKDQKYLVMVVAKEQRAQAWDVLRGHGASRFQMESRRETPAGAIRSCDEAIARMGREIDESGARIKELAQQGQVLKVAYDVTGIRLDCGRTRQKLVHTEKTFVLSAWVPKDRLPEIELFLSKTDCYFEFVTPAQEEEPPVLLKNSKLVEPFEVVTEMYSLPAPNSMDPDPFLAVFYFIFFGMMLSDAGYGLLLVFGGLFALRKMDLSPFAKKFVKLITFGGVSTVIWGALYGSWFGNLVSQFSITFLGKEVVVPALLDPLNDPITILGISFALGAIHLFCGMGLKAYLMIKRGHLWDAVFDVGFWYLVLIGAPMLALGGTAGKVGMYLAIAGAVGLILTQGRSERNPVKKIVTGVLSLYDISGYVSDLLSYSRILALGLATGVIANVVNIMGTLAGKSIVGVLAFIAIFLFGHALNLAINALGSYVHASRLQYVEFFGKFYEGGGKPFAPLKANTKYVIVTDKED